MTFLKIGCYNIRSVWRSKPGVLCFFMRKGQESEIGREYMKRRIVLAVLLVLCAVAVSGCGLRKVDPPSNTTEPTHRQTETSGTTKKNAIPTITPVSTAETSTEEATVPYSTTIPTTTAFNAIPGSVTYDGFIFVVPEEFGDEGEDSKYDNKYYYFFSPDGEFTMLHFFILNENVNLQSESFDTYAQYFFSGFAEPDEIEWDFDVMDFSNAYVGIKKAEMVYYPENGLPQDVACYLMADLEDGRLINVNMMQQQGTAYDLMTDVEEMVRGVIVESMIREGVVGDSGAGISQELQGIRPEFRSKMDDSLTFVRSYCDFMKKFKDSGNPTEMKTEYNAYVEQYQNLMQELGALINGELSSEELDLYIDVMEKIGDMLSDLL